MTGDSRSYRILVPLDGSSLAEAALRHAGILTPAGARLELTLLGVVDDSDDFADAPADEIERAANLLEAYLRETARAYAGSPDALAAARLEIGIPAETILGVADELGVDAIAIATHGRSGFDRWRFGSVADKVIRGAQTPVLAIGPVAADGAEPPLALPDVLVPLDGSTAAESALATAERIAGDRGAGLHLVRVLTPAVHTEYPLGARGASPTYFLTTDAAKAYLQKVAEGLPAASVTTEVLLGWPEDRIPDYAAANGIGLIVMTSHGRGGFARAALGSVTDRLIGSPTPVLVVPSVHQG